jgi:hypothetical protein
MVSIVGLFFSTSVLRGGSMRTVGYYLLRTVSIVGLYGVYRGFLTYKNTPVSIDENSMHNKKKLGHDHHLLSVLFLSGHNPYRPAFASCVTRM